MRQGERAGLRKVARAYHNGDEDAAIRAVVETYKDTVRLSTQRLSEIAKVLAHARREHPGPFHGMDERMLVSLMGALSEEETDKSLAATIIGLALREAAKYSWRKEDKNPRQFTFNGQPMFLSAEDVGCWICSPPPPDEEEVASEIPEAEDDIPEDVLRLGMSPESLVLLGLLPERELKLIKRFIVDVVESVDPKPGTAVATIINKYVARNGAHLTKAIEATVKGMTDMAAAGVRPEVQGLTEQDALVMIAQLMGMPHAGLVATVFGVIAGFAGASREVQAASKGRPASFVDDLLKHEVTDIVRQWERERKGVKR